MGGLGRLGTGSGDWVVVEKELPLWQTSVLVRTQNPSVQMQHSSSSTLSREAMNSAKLPQCF